VRPYPAFKKNIGQRERFSSLQNLVAAAVGMWSTHSVVQAGVELEVSQALTAVLKSMPAAYPQLRSAVMALAPDAEDFVCLGGGDFLPVAFALRCVRYRRKYRIAPAGDLTVVLVDFRQHQGIAVDVFSVIVFRSLSSPVSAFTLPDGCECLVEAVSRLFAWLTVKKVLPVDLQGFQGKLPQGR
jgi:hypothetical protein